MYKIAVCDDHLPTVDHVDALLTKEFADQCTIFTFDAPRDLEQYVNEVLQGTLDILIIDVDLVVDNGIQVAERLKSRYPGIRVIFISGRIQFVLDVFEIRPIYFLEKPIDSVKLQSAVRLAIRDIERDARDIVSIESKGTLVKLNLKEVLYFESNQRMVVVYLNGEEREIYNKLDVIEKQLPDRFCRCHQSFLVNFDFVLEMTAFQFVLFNRQAIPISQSRHKDVKRAFAKYLGNSL